MDLLRIPTVTYLTVWMNRLLKQRQKLMLLNKKYWGGLGRKSWLVYDNKNSKLFQCRANIRRERKLLIKIKDEYAI